MFNGKMNNVKTLQYSRLITQYTGATDREGRPLNRHLVSLIDLGILVLACASYSFFCDIYTNKRTPVLLA